MSIVKEQNKILEVKTLAMKEDTNRFISLTQENKKNIDGLYDIYLDKKRVSLILRAFTPLLFIKYQKMKRVELN